MKVAHLQDVGPGRYRVVMRVLCFVTSDEDVLLLKGSPDKPTWPGLFNGVGGHVERGEDVLSAARREILEETGLVVQRPLLRGVLSIETSDPSTGVIVFVFIAETMTRRVQASAEGELRWVPVARVGELPVVDDVPMLLAHALGSSIESGPFYATYRCGSHDELVFSFTQ